MAKPMEAKGADIPVLQLRPLNERKRTERGFRKIVATIRAVGLIEPICVYRDGDHYCILDGYLRYLACMELGVETVPCLIYKSKEAYSFNRMVNHLSPVQENRMLRKSLEVLDEKTVAKALGLTSIRTRLHSHLISQLHPEVLKEFDAGRMPKGCAQAMTLVKLERQHQILKEMNRVGDFSSAFARAMIIRTPPKLRAKLASNRKNPWGQEDKKRQLYHRLVEMEQRYDFYSALYRQYVADIMKICVYARKIITHERIRPYLERKHLQELKQLNEIIFETERAAKKTPKGAQ